MDNDTDQVVLYESSSGLFMFCGPELWEFMARQPKTYPYKFIAQGELGAMKTLANLRNLAIANSFEE